MPDSHADSYSRGNRYGYTDSDTYTDSNTNGNSNGDSDINTNGHAYGDVHSYSHADSYTYCACYSNTYADLRPCRLAIGSAPASGPLCLPGRPRHGQHALHRRRS